MATLLYLSLFGRCIKMGEPMENNREFLFVSEKIQLMNLFINGFLFKSYYYWGPRTSRTMAALTHKK